MSIDSIDTPALKQHRREEMRKLFADLKQQNDANQSRRQSAIESLPGYQAMKCDPKFHLLVRQWKAAKGVKGKRIKLRIEAAIFKLQLAYHAVLPDQVPPLVVKTTARQLAERPPTVVESSDTSAKVPTAKVKRRRNRPSATGRPVTPEQAEAVQVVGECKGNYSAAARQLGKDRTTVKQLYDDGLRNAKLSASQLKPKVQNLPHDRRGQTLAADDD